MSDEYKSNKRARSTSVADVSQAPASPVQAGPALQDEALSPTGGEGEGSAPTGGEGEGLAPTGADDDGQLSPVYTPPSEAGQDTLEVEVDTTPEREASPSPNRYPPRARGSRARGASDDADPLSRSAVDDNLRFIFESGTGRRERSRPVLLHCRPITRRRLSDLNSQEDMCRVLFSQHRLALEYVDDARAAVDIVLDDLLEAAAGSQNILWTDAYGGMSDTVRVVRVEYFLSRYKALKASLTRFKDEEREASTRAADKWETLKVLYRRTTWSGRHDNTTYDAYEIFFTRLRRILDRGAS